MTLVSTGRSLRRALGCTLAAALAAGALAAAPGARAQTAPWPERPIRLLVPFAPGGNTDGIARITADWLSPRLGQQVVVENRTGAGGAIATEALARARPDGHTLMMITLSQVAILPEMQRVPYDPARDFAWVSIMASNMFALAVNAEKMPARSVREFIEHVKARQGQLSYASGGAGSVSHLSMAFFVARAGLRMEHVPYRGGAPAMTDLIAGVVPAYFGNLSESLPQLAGGRIRVLAVSGPARARQLPEVPTVAEAGLEGFRTVTWNGVIAPAGTPAPIIERLVALLRPACADAAFAARLDEFGTDPVCGTPAEFARTAAEDVRLWADAVRLAGLRRAE